MEVNMVLLPKTVERLAQIGANIEITDGSNYLPRSIENIIRIAVGKGAHVTIEAGNYLPQSLESFAQIGKQNVTIKI
jgi:hypothetical protein